MLAKGPLGVKSKTDSRKPTGPMPLASRGQAGLGSGARRRGGYQSSRVPAADRRCSTTARCSSPRSSYPKVRKLRVDMRSTVRVQPWLALRTASARLAGWHRVQCSSNLAFPWEPPLRGSAAQFPAATLVAPTARATAILNPTDIGSFSRDKSSSAVLRLRAPTRKVAARDRITEPKGPGRSRGWRLIPRPCGRGPAAPIHTADGLTTPRTTELDSPPTTPPMLRRLRPDPPA